MPVANGFRAGQRLPIGRARIVGQDPGAAGVKPLGDDGKTGLQFLGVEAARADNVADLRRECARVEFGLQALQPPPAAAEYFGRVIDVHLADIAGRIAKRQARRDNRASGCAADQVKMVAQTHRPACLFRKLGFHPLQKGQRQNATHTAAVQCQNTLWSGPEKMFVTRIGHGHA